MVEVMSNRHQNAFDSYSFSLQHSDASYKKNISSGTENTFDYVQNKTIANSLNSTVDFITDTHASYCQYCFTKTHKYLLNSKNRCLILHSAVTHLRRSKLQRIFPFILGILVGVAFTSMIFQHRVLLTALPLTLEDSQFNKIKTNQAMKIDERKHFPSSMTRASSNKDTEGTKEEKVNPAKTRLFVGVITAEKFLSTRAMAVNNTWGAKVDQLEFFTQRGSRQRYGIPVVNLERVSDSEYPPQKKAFEMLKHICQNYIDDFEWFIRADDDVYIRVELLKKFLTHFASDKMIYMGQPGHGVPEVRQRLGLRGHNFCMGGPGVIFNQKALKKLCPHIDKCMEEVVSKEEDVEIGRCVTNHLHIECTHAWDTLTLFYHSYQEEYREDRPFLGNLAENDHVAQALTLHHLKLPYIMYKVHRHYTNLLLNSTAQAQEILAREVNELSQYLPNHERRSIVLERPTVSTSLPKRLQDVNVWKSFTTDAVFSISPTHVMQDITNDVLADLKQIGETCIDTSIDNSRVRSYSYSHVIDGAMRWDYERGMDYQFDIFFTRKLSYRKKIKRVRMLRPAGTLQLSGIKRTSRILKGRETFFNVVVVFPSLISKSSEFETFMRNFYEPVLLAGGRSSLARLVVVFVDHVTDSPLENWSLKPQVHEVLKIYHTRYPDTVLTALPPSKMKFRNQAAAVEYGYARGVAHVKKLTNLHGLDDQVVLLTSTNFTLSPDVVRNCYLKTHSHFYHNNSFTNYKKRRKKPGSSVPPQLYQPIPFHVYSAADVGPWPSAMVPQSVGLHPGAGGVPAFMIHPLMGFWDVGSSHGVEDDVVLAPLCARLKDIYEPASAALNATDLHNFRESLYKAIHAGTFDIVRTPDRSFSTYIAR